VCIALALGASLTMAVAGWRLEGPTSLIAVGGWLGCVMVALAAPIAILAAVRTPLAGTGGGVGALAREVAQLSEQAALSDDARRVLNRRRERQLLRDAIIQDIEAEDWDAAMVLVKELAERFGYRADAEEFRQQIEHARFETVQRRVDEAIAHLDALIVQRHWDQGLVEAARIGRLYPDTPRVDGLRHRVEQARHAYKVDLERRFLHAAQEERIDEAMDLLRELDAYLTEAEAGPFREVARGVIGKARENLGVQFKLALQDRRWNDAAGVGERIIEQFPNSRMAQEVRGMLESIKARSVGVGAASENV
jgi:hypothetical protein